ncbi:hypothetical protein [Mycolicibacterium fallax]|uniref:hypothetical protein n=1 Tax=Mycolicibacterium fallax TaxID=1793 RepID=UPI0021F2E552|nr:hypothetical protein [Mycolicibacterium fallax]
MAAPTPLDVLDYLDQAMFLGLRATGQAAVMQCIWIYDRPVDLDGVRRFHRNFGRGLAGRRIAPSPLPFGRHRWVTGTPGGLDIGTDPIPRAELGDWLDRRARLPVDPQWGPGWHLGVQPLADGGTAVSLVGSHCLTDGGGGVLEILNAVNGTPRELGHRPAGGRSRRAAVAADTRQLLRDLPAAAMTATMSRCPRSPGSSTPSTGAPPPRHWAETRTPCWRVSPRGSATGWAGGPDRTAPSR